MALDLFITTMASAPLTEADLQYIKDVLTDPTLGPLIIFASLLVNCLVVFGCIKVVKLWVEPRPWWPAAKVLQAQMMQNFGFREEDCTDEVTLHVYSLVCVFCIHHAILGIMAIPVIISGGRSGYLLFVITCIGDLGIDVVDFLRMAVSLCCAAKLNMAPTPLMMFISFGVLHHGLTICMIMPMLLNYLALAEFHYLVCSLLLAAGIVQLAGSYKFTLDTSQPSGFRQYKVIVAIQFVTIWFSRCFLWFWCFARALRKFADDGSNTFWWGGLVCGCLMTMFNILMIMDCTEAAIKWLPRAMPENEEEAQELQVDIVKSDGATPVAAARRLSQDPVGEARRLSLTLRGNVGEQ